MPPVPVAGCKLACLGWPQVRLAERIGVSAERVRRLQLGGTRVRKATAEAIAAVYEQLWDTPPAEATQRQRRTAELPSAGQAAPVGTTDGLGRRAQSHRRPGGGA